MCASYLSFNNLVKMSSFDYKLLKQTTLRMKSWQKNKRITSIIFIASTTINIYISCATSLLNWSWPSCFLSCLNICKLGTNSVCEEFKMQFFSFYWSVRWVNIRHTPTNKHYSNIYAYVICRPENLWVQHNMKVFCSLQCCNEMFLPIYIL